MMICQSIGCEYDGDGVELFDDVMLCPPCKYKAQQAKAEREQIASEKADDAEAQRLLLEVHARMAAKGYIVRCNHSRYTRLKETQTTARIDYGPVDTLESLAAAGKITLVDTPPDLIEKRKKIHKAAQEKRWRQNHPEAARKINTDAVRQYRANLKLKSKSEQETHGA